MNFALLSDTKATQWSTLAGENSSVFGVLRSSVQTLETAPRVAVTGLRRHWGEPDKGGGVILLPIASNGIVLLLIELHSLPSCTSLLEDIKDVSLSCEDGSGEINFGLGHGLSSTSVSISSSGERFVGGVATVTHSGARGDLSVLGA